MAGLSSDGIQLGSDWFWEDPQEAMYGGEAHSLKIKEIIYHQKSKYQDILVFNSVRFGRVLALDDIIQLTERDEFAYHEMMAHVTLYSHPCPKSVLVIGGGDGGMLRETVKHPIVEEVHLCEIDEEVISVSKKYFKALSVGFHNPKVKLFLQDGVEFVKQSKNRYDVIITDCSELGPAEVLYQQDYFKLIHHALKPSGIMCLQGQCLWQPDDMLRIKEVIETSRKIFAVTDYANVALPSFDTFGLVLNGKDKDMDFRDPVRVVSDQEADNFNLKFYDYETHKAAFVLPRFMRKELQLR